MVDSSFEYYYYCIHRFQSNAKSGQFFFYSKDGKYMIKTMTNAESKFLRRSKNQDSISLY